MRNLLPHEQPLVQHLFRQAGLQLSLAELLVQPMSDGNMGSLLLAPLQAGRRVGSSLAECHFLDQDGVLVSAVLNVDQNGMPYEIDVWKVLRNCSVAQRRRDQIRAGKLTI